MYLSVEVQFSWYYIFERIFVIVSYLQEIDKDVTCNLRLKHGKVVMKQVLNGFVGNFILIARELSICAG